MKKIAALFIAAALALGGAIFLSFQPAYAAVERCVPTEAVPDRVVNHPAVTEEVTRAVVIREAYDEVVFDHWQRYSWTGGPWTSDEAPPFPGDGWQLNVKGDPHDVGSEGPYFRSHGNSGNGDWFYLEAVTTTVHHDAVTETVKETVVIEEPWTETVPGSPAVKCPEPDEDSFDPECPDGSVFDYVRGVCTEDTDKPNDTQRIERTTQSADLDELPRTGMTSGQWVMLVVAVLSLAGGSIILAKTRGADDVN